MSESYEVKLVIPEDWDVPTANWDDDTDLWTGTLGDSLSMLLSDLGDNLYRLENCDPLFCLGYNDVIEAERASDGSLHLCRVVESHWQRYFYAIGNYQIQPEWLKRVLDKVETLSGREDTWDYFVPDEPDNVLPNPLYILLPKDEEYDPSDDVRTYGSSPKKPEKPGKARVERLSERFFGYLVGFLAFFFAFLAWLVWLALRPGP